MAVATWAMSRIVGPTKAQEQALATMRRLPPAVGRNAFEALWLLPYYVPESQRGRIVAEDLRRLAAPSRGHETVATATPYASSAEAGFPKQSLNLEEMALFCGGGGRDCLPVVQADLKRYAALVKRHAAIIDRAQALSQYATIRHPRHSQVLDTVIPPYQYAKLPATRYAVDFAEGRRYDAFDGACRGIDTWRRLGADSDSLITRLIGTAYSVDVYARLFVEMLAATPRDFALPASCDTAFLPLSSHELSMCPAMQGELLFSDAQIRQIESDQNQNLSMLERILAPLLFSAEMTQADRAEHLVFYCGEEAKKALVSDRRIVRPGSEPNLLRFECAGNPAGCMLSSIASPNFDVYSGRIQDANVKLRLIAVLVRLRADTRDQRPFDVRFRSAAAGVFAPERAVGIDADGLALQMRHYDAWRGEYSKIRLPAYFHTSGATASR